MLRLSGRRALNRLTWRTLRGEWRSHALAAVAIALTNLLFMALLTMVFGLLDALEVATIHDFGHSDHVTVHDAAEDLYDRLKAQPTVAQVSRERAAATVDAPGLAKRPTELWVKDDLAREWTLTTPTGGHAPVRADEISADTKTLEKLGVPLKEGATVKLTLTTATGQVERDFTLAGWWEPARSSVTGEIQAGPAYADAHPDELFPGGLVVRLKFASDDHVGRQLEDLLAAMGYSDDPEAANYLPAEANMAYGAVYMTDSTTWILLGAIGVVITAAGALIIVNIFNLTVAKSVRFLGLLKTVGTTSRQLRSLVRRQALLLTAVGLPLGLAAGFFAGRALVPALLRVNNMGNYAIRVEPHPLAFAGAALFTVVVVLLSASSPGRRAGRVSPVEATRYTAAQPVRHGAAAGARHLSLLAWAGLARRPARTALTVASLSLSLVVVAAVVSLTRSFDTDAFLADRVDTDFLVADFDYVLGDYVNHQDPVSADLVAAVQAQPGFEQGGYFYFSQGVPLHVDAAGDQVSHRQVYGLDDFPLARRTVLAGTLDLDRLAQGDAIVEAIYDDDEHFPDRTDDSDLRVGDKVTLAGATGERRTFTVVAQVRFDSNPASARFFEICEPYDVNVFYLPTAAYRDLVAEPNPMSYVFDVADADEAAMEAFLADYTEDEEPTMGYESKATALDDLGHMEDLFATVGLGLGGIIGLIGVLNYVNSMVTSLLARRREFAVMEAVGLTGRQLTRLVAWEALAYVVLTLVASLGLAYAFGRWVVAPFADSLWFARAYYTVAPVLWLAGPLAVAALAIAWAARRTQLADAVVDRLRLAD